MNFPSKEQQTAVNFLFFPIGTTFYGKERSNMKKKVQIFFFLKFQKNEKKERKFKILKKRKQT